MVSQGGNAEEGLHNCEVIGLWFGTAQGRVQIVAQAVCELLSPRREVN